MLFTWVASGSNPFCTPSLQVQDSPESLEIARIRLIAIRESSDGRSIGEILQNLSVLNFANSIDVHSNCASSIGLSSTRDARPN